jgi:hypothetical protein
MEWAFSVGVSLTKIWRFPTLGFYFGGHIEAIDPLPLVGRRHVAGMAIGQPENIWPPEFRIACAAGLGDFQKAQCYGLADRGPDRVAVNAVAAEVVIGDGQLAVVDATMVGEFDFDPIQHAPG